MLSYKGPNMDSLLAHFEKEADGSWTCIEPAEFDGPQGRIQVTPGSRLVRGREFMGIDLAGWLDELAAKYYTGKT